MNTENVYFGKLYEVCRVKDNYYNEVIELDYRKNVLIVVKTNFFGNPYMKDLNTNENYKMKLSDKIGTLYVSRSTIKAFDYVTNNDKKNLPKRKIKQIGNKYLDKKEK